MQISKKNRNESLQSSYQKRRERSISSVSHAIDWLRENNKKLTLENISEATKKFSIGGTRVSASTIIRNQECFDLYNNAADPKRRKVNAKKVVNRELEGLATDKEMRRFHLLKRLSKAQLLAIIIKNEKTIEELEKANSLLRDEYLTHSLGPL